MIVTLLRRRYRSAVFLFLPRESTEVKCAFVIEPFAPLYACHAMCKRISGMPNLKRHQVYNIERSKGASLKDHPTFSSWIA